MTTFQEFLNVLVPVKIDTHEAVESIKQGLSVQSINYSYDLGLITPKEMTRLHKKLRNQYETINVGDSEHNVWKEIR